MTKWVWEKLSFFVGLITVAVFFGLVVIEANIEIKDLDLWLHLAAGKYILEHWSIPNVDVLSCTIAGKPWINHEWLFQVILRSIYDSFGPEGLLTLQAVVVTLTFGLLFFLGYNRDRQPVIIGLLLLSLLVYELRFTIRPDIFSLLFFVFYFYLLAAHLMQPWTILVIFLIQILWTNIHGFFILGPLLIFLSMVAEWIKRYIPLPWEWNKVGRYEDDEFQQLKKIFFIVILACLFNPYGLEGILYPIKVLGAFGGDSRIFFESIKELQKPILTWQGFYPSEPYTEYKWLIIISFVSFILNYRRLDISVVLFWLVFLLFSLNAVRNIVFFAFSAYLVVIANLARISLGEFFAERVKNSRVPFMAVIVINIALMAWMVDYANKQSFRGYFDFDKWERKSEFGGVSLRNFPYKAVDFLDENNISGNFFNDFNSGAYLLGHVYPKIKVFIDGRTEVYGSRFYQEYQNVWGGQSQALDEAVDKYKLTGAFISFVMQPAPPGLINYFYKHQEWVLVYFDYDGMVYLKKVPQNQDLIDKFAIDLKQWKTMKIDLLKIGTKNIPSFQQTNRAYALLALKLYDQALGEAQEALRIDSNNSESYKVLGRVCLERKEYEKALEYLRKAKILSSQDPEIRYYLAKAFFYLGDLSKAREQTQFVLDQNSNNFWGLFFMALIDAKEMNYAQALELAQKGHKAAPSHLDSIMDLGDLLFAQNEFAWAKEVYIIALDVKEQEAEVLKKIELCDAALGKKLE